MKVKSANNTQNDQSLQVLTEIMTAEQNIAYIISASVKCI